MSKILISLFIVLFIIISSLFSSGCENTDNSVSDVSFDLSRPVSYPEDGVIDLPDDIIYQTNADGWKAAMSAEQFENVTLTSYSDDSDKTNADVMKIDGDKCFQALKGEVVSEEGNFTYKNDVYFYKENGRNYRVVLSETTDKETGKVTKSEKKQEDEEYGGITAERLVSDDDSIIAFITDKFDKFIYSNKIGLYTARFSASDYPDAGITDLEIHVGFKDGKLDCIKYKSLKEENATFESTYSSDYGKTVIEIPEVE